MSITDASSTIIYRDKVTVFAYNPTEQQLLNILMENGTLNYFEIKYVQENYREYVYSSARSLPTPYFVGGMRNYAYIIISNHEPYPPAASGTFAEMLYFASQTPDVPVGCVRSGFNNYGHTSSPITNPYDVTQKTVSGHTVSGTIVTDPVGSSSPAPDIPDTQLDNITVITAIDSSLVYPCYILPQIVVHDFTEPEFVQYAMS
jgi:hypothetical protein